MRGRASAASSPSYSFRAPAPCLTSLRRRRARADGNAEADNHDDGAGTMEAVYFGNATTWGKGQGAGPWVMADMENGLFAGNTRENDNNTPLTSEFVTAMVKGGENGFALKGGDATQGGLKTMYDGARPNGYQPMKKCVHQKRARHGPHPASPF